MEGHRRVPSPKVFGFHDAQGVQDLIIGDPAEGLVFQGAEDAAQVVSVQYSTVEVRGAEVDAAKHVHQLAIIYPAEVCRAHGAQEPSNLALELVQTLLEEFGIEGRRRNSTHQIFTGGRARRWHPEEGGLEHGKSLVFENPQEVLRH